jgi:hypothetical protein
VLIKELKSEEFSNFNFEGTAFSQLAFASCGFRKNIFAVIACNNGLSMTEDNSSFVTSSTLDIHKVGVGRWDKSFEFMALSFVFECGVKEISIHVNCWL